MIYTKTGEYAIRAILNLARQPKDKLIMSSEIAKDEEIPTHYLAKILQKLARYGYVDSFKGRGGGFKINEKAEKSSILEIVEKVEGPVIDNSCVTGLKQCSEEYPCPLHDEWAKIREQIYTLISSKSVKEVAATYAKPSTKNQ
jgi:Rrf2 family transcriptional regulator, iron-sulfur cluster assembly transcription factor